MRLLDADALIDDIKNNLWDWETVDGITATTVLKQTITDIKNQPTVDAIPVEWINRWYDRNYMYADIEIDDLLNDWKEENGK